MAPAVCMFAVVSSPMLFVLCMLLPQIKVYRIMYTTQYEINLDSLRDVFSKTVLKAIACNGFSATCFWMYPDWFRMGVYGYFTELCFFFINGHTTILGDASEKSGADQPVEYFQECEELVGTKGSRRVELERLVGARVGFVYERFCKPLAVGKSPSVCFSSGPVKSCFGDTLAGRLCRADRVLIRRLAVKHVWFRGRLDVFQIVAVRETFKVESATPIPATPCPVKGADDDDETDDIFAAVQTARPAKVAKTSKVVEAGDEEVNAPESDGECDEVVNFLEKIMGEHGTVHKEMVDECSAGDDGSDSDHVPPSVPDNDGDEDELFSRRAKRKVLASPNRDFASFLRKCRMEDTDVYLYTY